eukprot:GHVT01100469.1.p1 GENE.GHVT01100469.1~~GHVT01100469.1.p1  ORF type:complete len:340 (+),score=55.88 GHVT01100469.1:730-1749(+)
MSCFVFVFAGHFYHRFGLNVLPFGSRFLLVISTGCLLVQLLFSLFPVIPCSPCCTGYAATPLAEVAGTKVPAVESVMPSGPCCCSVCPHRYLSTCLPPKPDVLFSFFSVPTPWIQAMAQATPKAPADPASLTSPAVAPSAVPPHPDGQPLAHPIAPPLQVASLAGGCFWGMEKLFRDEFKDKLIATWVGFMGGQAPNPTYPMVRAGDTGHAETLQIIFDSRVISFDQLLDHFFCIHDPTTIDQQEEDIGPMYRSCVFVHSPEQEAAVKSAVVRLRHHWPSPFVTEVTAAKPEEFWPAERYHQLYLENNPDGYCVHRKRWDNNAQQTCGAASRSPPIPPS